MNYGYNKSVLENAGYSSLDAGPYGNRSPLKGQGGPAPQNQQQGKDDRVSFARNFKMRLFNGDPQEQRSREAVKDNYKRQLELQMAENKRRKQLEKKKLEEEDMKYERAFYENQKQLDQASKDERSPNPQRKRASSQKSIPSPHNKSFEDKEAQKQFNIIDGLLANDLSQGLPSLLQQKRVERQERQPQQPYKNMFQYSYEDQRMASIKEFQQSILRKMEGIRQEIQKTEKKLETKNEFDRIKNLLHREIIPFESANNQSQKFYDVNRIQRRNIEAPPPYRPIENAYDLNASGQYQQLDGRTEVKYPEEIRTASAQGNFPSKQIFNRAQKSQSSEAQQQQYDKVQVPDLPSKFKKSNSNYDPMGSFQSKPSKFSRSDPTLDRAKFIPKTDIIDYKIDNMLSNIDNLIAHYDKD